MKTSLKVKILEAFESEFGFMNDKFEIMDLLSNNSSMDYEIIDGLKLPSEVNNIVWHPGVYFFIGNDSLYRVGVSMNNSRARVMQHLDACTMNSEHGIWDIDKFDDKAILLINVKNKIDRHWLLAIEAFFEINFHPKIRAGRIG
ncbi:hypothetical protein WJU23_18675 [Prosthecobacter sp. SYSU 5D2]|uniref:hypothetical protein n=1 Tax=Prosthecobacter sp. SYSU 5D2 TaxID=3134134 RepID=UPI0031FE9952